MKISSRFSYDGPFSLRNLNYMKDTNISIPQWKAKTFHQTDKNIDTQIPKFKNEIQFKAKINREFKNEKGLFIEAKKAGSTKRETFVTSKSKSKNSLILPNNEESSLECIRSSRLPINNRHDLINQGKVINKNIQIEFDNSIEPPFNGYSEKQRENMINQNLGYINNLTLTMNKLQSTQVPIYEKLFISQNLNSNSIKGLRSIKKHIVELKNKSGIFIPQDNHITAQAMYEGLKYGIMLNKKNPKFESNCFMFKTQFEKQRYLKIQKEFSNLRKIICRYPNNKMNISKDFLQKFLNVEKLKITDKQIYLFIKFVLENDEYQYDKTMQEILLKAMKIFPQEYNLQIDNNKFSKTMKTTEFSKSNTFSINSGIMKKSHDSFLFKKVQDHSQVQDNVLNYLINNIDYENNNNDSPRLRYKIKSNRLITLSVDPSLQNNFKKRNIINRNNNILEKIILQRVSSKNLTKQTILSVKKKLF